MQGVLVFFGVGGYHLHHSVLELDGVKAAGCPSPI